MSSGADVDLSAIHKRLDALGRRVRDFSPITPVLSEILVAAVNERWDSAGDGQWPPLAPSTIAKRRGSSAQILKNTGRAAASVRGEYDHESASAVTDTSYMVYHVSDGPRTIIPLRNPFDVYATVEGEIVETLSEWIANGT